MTLSIFEAKKQLQACFPAGSEQLYDWDNLAVDIGQDFQAYGQLIKERMSDLADQLRLEVNPGTCTNKIPDWESALGLSNTPLAKFGTIAQRRKQILSWLRQSGSFSLDDIRAIMQPFFNYADPSQIQIVETDAAALQSQHMYAGAGTPIAIGANSVATSTANVLDDSLVSSAGAAALFTLTGNLDQISVSLAGPSGNVGGVPPGGLGTGTASAQSFTLHFPAAAFGPILGHWTLAIKTGSAGATLHFWTVYVDGIGYLRDKNGVVVGEGLGSAQYEFSVIADPALLGPGYDLEGAFRALRRMKPAHVKCGIQVASGLLGAGIAAIPDDLNSAIPDRAIPA